MAKNKNKRRSADSMNKKREAPNIKKNPFEIHINKEKFSVLGRQSKNDKGIPGISRAKGIKKRKETLLQEYKVRTKSNLFRDKRIGEGNREMTEEERKMARFTAVRVKTHKQSIYNLADDEVLTHKGQTLSEIEKFEDPGLDDDDDDDFEDDEAGRLNADFVADAHFGGGILQKSSKDGAKTHKEIIDQLIAESKKRKEEKQQLREATIDLTQKLDAEWKDLLPLVNSGNSVSNEKSTQKRQVDDFDKTVAQLKFEARGIVSDRLKSEEEIAKEEKEKLEQLEKERLQRMKGIFEETPIKPTFRSVDELDDIDYESDSEPENTLTYNEQGQSNVQVNAYLNGKKININREREDNSDTDEDNKKSENHDPDGVSDDDHSKDDSEDNASQNSESESKDNFSDLQDSDSANEDSDGTNTRESYRNTVSGDRDDGYLESSKRKTSDCEKPDDSVKKLKISDVDLQENEKQLQENIKIDLQKRKEMMDKARQELPYVFPFPSSYEDLQKLFESRSSDHISVIIERLIKANHPSLADGNKDKLGTLLVFLMQYINDIFSDVSKKNLNECFQTLKYMTPYIFDIANFDKIKIYNCLAELIKEKHQKYRKRPKIYPGLENLIFFKLVSLLFTTSDFQHKVVTPCFIYMDQMLTKCKIKSKRDISYGLFLTTLVLEYTTLSKRFLPAALNFLGGIFHMAIPKRGVKIIKVLPPFRATESALALHDGKSNCGFSSPLKMKTSDLVGDSDCNIVDEFKIRAVFTAIKLAQEFSSNLQELPSFVEIFEPILCYLKAIPKDNYPQIVRQEFDLLIETLEKRKSERKLKYVALEAKKPKTLRFLEPEIEEIFDRKSHKVQSKEKAERAKLLYKLKKETKGAVREIRKDRAFLGRVKIQQRLQSDKKRKEKVNKIFSEAAMQQNELNALDRSKKRKK